MTSSGWATRCVAVGPISLTVAAPGSLEVDAVCLAVGWPGNADLLHAPRSASRPSADTSRSTTLSGATCRASSRLGTSTGSACLCPVHVSRVGSPPRTQYSAPGGGSRTSSSPPAASPTPSTAGSEVERHRRYILGAHVLGEYSAEVIQTVSACMAANLRIEQIAELVPAFPTVTEGITVAAQTIVRQMGIASSAPSWGELCAADTPPGASAPCAPTALSDPQRCLEKSVGRAMSPRVHQPWA